MLVCVKVHFPIMLSLSCRNFLFDMNNRVRSQVRQPAPSCGDYFKILRVNERKSREIIMNDGGQSRIPISLHDKNKSNSNHHPSVSTIVMHTKQKVGIIKFRTFWFVCFILVHSVIFKEVRTLCQSSWMCWGSWDWKLGWWF